MEHKWRKAWIALAVAIVLALGVFALRGGFSLTESYDLYVCLSDAFFVPGILFVIPFFLLLLVFPSIPSCAFTKLNDIGLRAGSE